MRYSLRTATPSGPGGTGEGQQAKEDGGRLANHTHFSWDLRPSAVS